MTGPHARRAPRGRTIYLDNAATSWPKPPGVADALCSAVSEFGANPGRGAYRLALETGRAVHAARHAVASFLGVADAKDLVFQPSCTYALNLVLFGSIAPGQRVVTTSMEHNAVARPLAMLKDRGVEVVVVRADSAGVLDPEDVERAVSAAPTRAVVCQHASNVTGAVQPVADIVDIAHAHGALAIIDGAQAAGHLAVDLTALGADAWACSGHKGLLGPAGIGVLHLAPGFEPTELVAGGTGSGASEEPLQPRERPDRYEAGTLNTPGILGLAAGVGWLAEHGEEQRAREARLTRMLVEGLAALPGVRVLGPGADEPRVPIVPIVHASIPADRLAYELDARYSIAVRAGLHCAPWAHRTLGTLETGAVRFSVGHATTEQDVADALDALAVLIGELA